ncbi:hypothetical protein A3F66_00715 [candidate division TM6 bacterium RIFCSPHIGHO2_12_FULL_32_22]|nr:MAG: hypothetical protein A3F66_00715 [candidate division TM6 bacterium RIFCSPHIGHO2_12_FULL_32_22]
MKKIFSLLLLFSASAALADGNDLIYFGVEGKVGPVRGSAEVGANASNNAQLVGGLVVLRKKVAALRAQEKVSVADVAYHSVVGSAEFLASDALADYLSQKFPALPRLVISAAVSLAVVEGLPKALEFLKDKLNSAAA